MNATMLVDSQAVLTPHTVRAIREGVENPFTRLGEYLNRGQRDIVIAESSIRMFEGILERSNVRAYDIGVLSEQYLQALHKVKGQSYMLDSKAELTYAEVLVDLLPENAFGRYKGHVTPHGVSILSAAVFAHDISASKVSIVSRDAGVGNGVKFLNGAGFNFSITTAR